MKYLFCFLLVIAIHSNSRAADTLITRFINSIYKQVINSGQTNYYLFKNGGSPTEFGEGKIDFSFKNTNQVPKNLKNIPFNDFKKAIQQDTNSIDWNNYKLKNVNVVDNSHFHCQLFKVLNITANTPDSILKKPVERCEVVVHLDSGLSKKQIDSVDNKVIDAYDSRTGQ